MDRICIKLHNIIYEGPQNLEECISWIIYIANLTENSIGPNDIELSSNIVSSSCRLLYQNDIPTLMNVLREVEERKVLNYMEYSIAVADNWLFQVILLNSVKNLSIFHTRSENCETETLIHIIQYIIKCIDVVREKSLYLLKTLQFILNKQDALSTVLSLNILKCMNKVALSPIPAFKQTAHGISKTVIHFLSYECQESISNSLVLPLRGIETYTFLRLFPNKKIRANLVMYIKKVLKMFANSIENKDGGFLYERLLICSFEEWKAQIWPYFLIKLVYMEYEGEFYQSLVKYWIPFSVAAYKTDFYGFIKNEPIDLILKASVLLESRKQGYPLEDADIFYYNVETRNLGLRLAATYRKKSLRPIECDIEIMMNFLYSNLGTFLEEHQLKSLRLMISQMSFYANNDLKKHDENFALYEHFVNQLYKYCYGSLNTDIFEVGAQVLHILWTSLTGSYKDLTLLYKVDKKDAYGIGENLLYMKLKDANKWEFESIDIVSQIKSCLLRNDYYSPILTNLILQYYPNYTFLDINDFKRVIARVEKVSTLQNTEKIINCSNIIFQTGLYSENETFVEEIKHSLLENLSLNTGGERLFTSVLFLEILTVARKYNIKVQQLEVPIEKCLNLIESIVESDFIENAPYKSRKVFETFVAVSIHCGHYQVLTVLCFKRLIFCITHDLHSLWPCMNKMSAIRTLKKVINKSNMKKPVSLSVEILRQFGSKMNENEEDKLLKFKLMDETLYTMYETSLRSDLKMRRNPESRLVIHALCVSQKSPDKTLLQWVFDYLLNLISDAQSSNFSISSSLHTIELLISDNRLQQQTLHYIPSLIVHCVEVFKNPSWTVRNANLQLAKSLIERIYGVSLRFFNRPKSIEDLFLVFPNLATYFYKILSSDVLDERSVIVFHFFLESQIKEQVFDNGVREILEYFQILFVHIIKNYQNHFGKLAVRSYVSLCHSKNIPAIIDDIAKYLMANYTTMKKNIFANCVFLVQELYDKYENSFEHFAKPKWMVKIQYTLNNLLIYLRSFDTELHDFLLLKVRSRSVILDCLVKNSMPESRIWLNNNVPFVISTTEPSHMFSTLSKIMSNNHPSFIHIKILSILVCKFENNEFSKKDLQNIVRILFRNSIEMDDSNLYLHTCYFKVLILFIKYSDTGDVPLIEVPSNFNSLYKTMIYILYFSVAETSPKMLDNFYHLVRERFRNSMGINEDTDNDIISTLSHCIENSPEEFRFEMCKMIFYFSQFETTHLETYYFISSFMEKSYSNILCALKEFMSLENIRIFLRSDEYLKLFFVEVNIYLDGISEDDDYQDDFYVVERDELIPKLFLKKIIWNARCIENKV